MASTLDELDRRLLEAMAAAPRAGGMELARRLEVARGTVQARLEKLQGRGIVTGFGPEIDLRAVGYEVTAFVSVEIAQGSLTENVDHLRTIPEVLEVHSVTGSADLLCRIVARTNEHLQDVIDAVLAAGGIERTTTQIALTEQIRYRELPLVTAGPTA